MSTLDEKVPILIKKRAVLKTYVTVCIDKLRELDDDNLKFLSKNHKVTIFGLFAKGPKGRRK